MSAIRFGPMPVTPRQLLDGHFYPDNKGRIFKKQIFAQLKLQFESCY